MRKWSLKVGEPLTLTLASDARLGTIDFGNDQIWELALGSGEPPSIALQTTYGLRARSLRLFPRFTEGDITVSDPAMFERPPTVQALYPNYVRLTCSPFHSIEVTAEYWIPESHACAGRLTIINLGKATRKLLIEWAALLTPTDDGQRMAPIVMGAGTVLGGQTGNLAPVIFLTGGPQVGSGPYPALSHRLEIPGNTQRAFIWSHAALGDQQASFEQARQNAARNWDAERGRIELANAGRLEVYTGNPEWDSAFYLAQNVAQGLIVGPTAHLPHPSLTLTRQPDRGYSPRGDGSDYDHLWNGQTPLEAHYLSSLLLPASPDLAQGLLRNFLSTAAEDGFVDWKPGLAGQRSQKLATPLLASLAERIYQLTGDRDFLEALYIPLVNFVLAWFAPARDRDGDGLPEWDHPMQTGFEDHPVFSRWHAWAQGAEITTAESPDLCAFLYRECQALMRIAAVCGREESVTALQAMADNLAAAVEAAWDADKSCYHYWDRDSHYSTSAQKLGEITGPGEIIIQRDFDHPIRLLARVLTQGEATRSVQIFIYGANQAGENRIERLPADHFRWYMGLGSATGERVYASLERVEIRGIDPHDQVSLHSVGYTSLDQTTLLPLWAGIPSPEHAEALVKQTITNPRLFWRPYGIRACAEPPHSGEGAAICQSIHLPWNVLVGEGLLAYGYREEAAELVARLMQAIIQSLKQDQAFRRIYHADTGQGQGERNALYGLAPLGLFLETLGVRILSPKRIVLSGFNPYPWPVTVKYRGLTVLRQKEKTIVVFPDGQTITTEGTALQTVTLE